MTTTIIIAISFITGFTICSILSWSVHRRHKQAWQKEYRRLMGGITTAVHDLRGWCHIITDKDRPDPPAIYKALQKVYNGDK